MTSLSHNRLRPLLREAWPPLDAAASERDVWPELRERLGRPHVRVSRLDLLLAAALLMVLLAYPAVIPGLLYHL